MSGATAEQFKNWREHAKTCSVQSLKHMRKVLLHVFLMAKLELKKSRVVTNKILI